ncbi:MAG: hypothetical protein NVSMB29_12380 [Candidatus Dormibacteria bacterium]
MINHGQYEFDAGLYDITSTAPAGAMIIPSRRQRIVRRLPGRYTGNLHKREPAPGGEREAKATPPA